jgi:NAD(P)-dependent dehydrogenase (short-subunit alcohol dehydrogenase family)
MNLKNKTILITGADRGIRRALVEESLSRGAERVYAGTRQAFIYQMSASHPACLRLLDGRRLRIRTAIHEFR